MRNADVKSFFRQQKAHSGAAATKPTGGVSKKPAHHLHKQSAAAVAAAHLLHPTPDHGDGSDARKEEEEERESAARGFDMDMRYGPCLGLTRAQRWRRAAALGLSPPLAFCSLDDHQQPCLWEGRV